MAEIFYLHVVYCLFFWFPSIVLSMKCYFSVNHENGATMCLRVLCTTFELSLNTQRALCTDYCLMLLHRTCLMHVNSIGVLGQIMAIFLHFNVVESLFIWFTSLILCMKCSFLVRDSAWKSMKMVHTLSACMDEAWSYTALVYNQWVKIWKHVLSFRELYLAIGFIHFPYSNAVN